MDRFFRLQAIHSRTSAHVTCSVGYFVLNETYGLFKIGSHAHIHNNHPGPRLPGQDIDSRTAAQKIDHHLPSDSRRVCANPLLGHTVVASHHDNRLAWERWMRHSADTRQLDGKRLQLTETPGRLCEDILPLSGLFSAL